MPVPPSESASRPDPDSSGDDDPIQDDASSQPRTQRLPLFPLGSVLAPEMPLSLHVFEPRYRQMVADLLRGAPGAAPEFGVVALRRGWEVGEVGDIHEIGTTALISDVVPLADGRCNLSAVGRRRFVIRSVDATSRPYLQAQVSLLPELDGALPAGAAATVRQLSQRHTGLLDSLGMRVADADELPVNAGALAYAMISQPGLTLVDRQAILAAADTAARLSTAAGILRREVTLVRRLRAVPVSAADFTSPTTPG